MARVEQPQSDVTVRVDNRARLIGALLAATRETDRAQARKKHGVHPHARATRKRMEPFHEHPAVVMAETLLEQGMSVEALFALAFTLNPSTLRATVPAAGLPAGLASGLADLATRADLDAWWKEEAAPWTRAVEETRHALDGVMLGPYLDSFFGSTAARLAVIPNIGFPAETEIALAAEGELITIVPPRLAWGESPPWPFDEDPGHVIRAIILACSRLRLADLLQTMDPSLMSDPLPVGDTFRALHPSWAEQYTLIIAGALVAVFLERHINAREASAYILMERRVHGLDILACAAGLVGEYLADLATGHSPGLSSFLLDFPARLRAACGG